LNQNNDEPLNGDRQTLKKERQSLAVLRWMLIADD